MILKQTSKGDGFDMFPNESLNGMVINKYNVAPL